MQIVWKPEVGAYVNCLREDPSVGLARGGKIQYTVETSLGKVSRLATRSDYYFCAVWGEKGRFVKGGVKNVIDATFHGTLDLALKSRKHAPIEVIRIGC
jgi:hypothetical protein